MKSIFEDFKKFALEQPKDKEIDHDGFETCAIGEFAKSLDKSVDLVVFKFAKEFGNTNEPNFSMY